MFQPSKYFPAPHFLILCCSILICSCRDNVVDRQDSESIDSRIRIGLWESIGGTQRSLSLQCTTERIYPCFNFRIQHEITKNGSAINITFTGIYKPQICLDALGTASAEIGLGSINDGIYVLSLTVNGTTLPAQLRVTGDAYHVTGGDGPWITFPQPDLLRVPDGTTWGYVGYHVASSEHFVRSFLDSLLSLGAQQQPYRPGEYGYFSIDPTGNIEQPGNLGYYFVRPFIYYFPNDTLLMRNLVKGYGKQFGDSLNIGLYGSHGEEYYSWMLRQEPGKKD